MKKFLEFINESLKDDDFHDIEAIFIGLEDIEDISIYTDRLKNRVIVEIYNELDPSNPIVLDDLIKYEEKNLFILKKLVTICKRLEYFDFEYIVEKNDGNISLSITKKNSDIKLEDMFINGRVDDEVVLRDLLKKNYDIKFDHVTYGSYTSIYLVGDIKETPSFKKLVKDLISLNISKPPTISNERVSGRGVVNNYLTKIALEIL
jgi:hypothetical protein